MAKTWEFLTLTVFVLPACVPFDRDLCYDRTWYATGRCQNLTSCEFSNDLLTGRSPEICGFDLGRSEPSICCPYSLSAPVYKPDKGKACRHKTWGIRGVCRPLESCSSAKLESSKGYEPQKCSSGVCCVPSEILCVVAGNGSTCACDQLNDTLQNPPKPKSVADSKCVEYSQYVCPDPIWYLRRDDLEARMNDYCPRPHSITTAKKLFIGDGYNVTSLDRRSSYSSGEQVKVANEFPHMALLGVGPRGRITFHCGGSLISPDFILTAAHCGQPQWALMGTLSRSGATAKPTPLYKLNPELRADPQVLAVQEVIPHPEYSREAAYNDIALLRLKKPAVMNMNVRPACLNTDSDEQGHPTVFGTGWGDTSDGAELPSDVLILARLRVQPLDNCTTLVDSRRLKRGLVDSHLCAGGDGLQDSCPGDSGGPLTVAKKFGEVYCMHSVLGVVSFGALTCGTGTPAVYTRVSFFVPWIESIVWPQG